ncbi:uncharacterized protein [Hemitrygon akajei]|uniref:uncharacterized protein n=1 Tax=Hemitrygon akajei TaxID=2704970 RepID=UPI003BFA079C
MGVEERSGVWDEERGLEGAVFGDSGGWKIPETVVPRYCCSGENPGWLTGPHPNVGEGEVTRTVCFTVDNNTCHWSLEIRVKNCSGYFVYWLGLTPWSNTVYCTVTDSALGDPCVTHTVLDQPWRSTDCSNTECTGGQWMGDGHLTVGWYRFNSSGGWKIPETVVPQGRCSGKNPGWLNGPHPNVGEGEVTRTVCFTVGGYTCYQRQEIRVKNCSGYFVYWLWPTPLSNTVSGGWKIPETVVPQGRCSGENPGWLNGPHPNVGEGEVTRTVCFTVGGNTCYGRRGINVKNCSGYFVYWLWPTPSYWSNAVYCTEPLSDTTQECQGSVTGEPGPGLTTSPAGSVSSGTDSQSDTTWEAQETTTGEPGLGLTSSPAGSLSSDLETSTMEQSTGLSTGEHIQELSSVPAGDTSSDSQLDTTQEPQASTSGEPSPDLSSTPAWSSSSEADLQSDITRETQGSATGDPGSGLTSTPAGSVNSDLEVSTMDQPDGSSTGQPTPSPSSVSAGQTSSGIRSCVHRGLSVCDVEFLMD